jgi:hypothetical protein
MIRVVRDIGHLVLDLVQRSVDLITSLSHV